MLQEVWATTLRAVGWRGSTERLDLLCSFLLKNEFYEWYQLTDDEDVASWSGASEFSAEELSCIDHLIAVGKKAPVSPRRVQVVSSNPCADLLAGRLTVKRNLTASYGGPRKSLRLAKLNEMSDSEREIWMEQSRLDALLGGCRLSLDSWRSGVRCYMSFVEKLFPDRSTTVCLPPALDTLLMWSTMFRCAGTFSNYLSYLRAACMVARKSTI